MKLHSQINYLFAFRSLSVRLGKNEKLKLFHYSTYDTIYKSHYTISTNFYIYLQYFQQ